MTIDPVLDDFCRQLAKHLSEQVDNLTDFTAKGDCANFKDYKNITGKIRGLKYSREALEDAYLKLTKDADK